MIGIIGYGTVGKAVEYGFPGTECIISDPQFNSTTITDVVACDPDAIFVCVPTPTDDSNYSELKKVLGEISRLDYKGLTVVKSTVLPHHIELFDVLYNPEFLSRATWKDDFVNPPMLIIGGDRAPELLQLYRKYSIVKTRRIFLTDVETAALVKYSMNSFYATKVTFMNEIYDVCNKSGANFDQVAKILSYHPWMGTHHFQVPGPDGERGFGGPCLPKDTEALVKEYDVDLLKKVLELNQKYRK